MLNSSYIYTFPILQQQPQHFAQLSAPYLLLSSPYNAYQQVPVQFQQISNPGSFNTCYLPQNIYLEQNKIDQEVTKNISNAHQYPQILKDKKKLRIQRLRDSKGRYFGVRKVPAQEKYKQNPKRNVITNIGNQLLAFVSNKSRSLGILKRMPERLSDEDISDFYEFMSELRKITDYYLNIHKMKELWYPTNLDKDVCRSRSRRLLRLLSYHYFTNMIHLFVLNSGKIRRSCKIYHIKAIRSLVKVLTPKGQS